MENYELLGEKITEGLDELNTDDPKYCEKVGAVKDLYELKIQEMKAQNDYYCKATELDNKATELEQQKQEAEKKESWWEKINPNTVITTVAMGIGTFVTLKFEKDGYLFKPPEFVRNLINRNK